MTLKGIWFVYEQAFTDICLAVSVIHKYQTIYSWLCNTRWTSVVGLVGYFLL